MEKFYHNNFNEVPSELACFENLSPSVYCCDRARRMFGISSGKQKSWVACDVQIQRLCVNFAEEQKFALQVCGEKNVGYIFHIFIYFLFIDFWKL